MKPRIAIWQLLWILSHLVAFALLWLQLAINQGEQISRLCELVPELRTVHPGSEVSL